MMRLRRFVWLALLAGFALAGCGGGLAWPNQPASAGPPAALVADGSVGQTVWAVEAGLKAVEVYLLPGGADGQVRLSLRAGPGAASALAESALPASAITAPGFYRFDFDPQANSQRRDYYIELTAQGGGQPFWAGASGADAYPHGALYVDGQPRDGQLAFRLVYDTPLAALGWAADGLRWAGWALLAALLFALPGLALLTWLWPDSSALGWAGRLCLAAGIGLALYPLLILWTGLLGLRLSAGYALLPPLVSAVALAPRALRAWRGGQARRALPAVDWPTIALALTAALLVASNFWAVRQVAAPMWGDSVQHAVLAQLFLDHGGMFSSWAPYAPYDSFTVQFGFPVMAALFAWATRLDAAQATMVAGQVLNVLAVLALYPLAVRLAGGNRWAGVGAVVAAGLFSPMPAYYVNWGRYAQLAGQAILPAALVLLWAAAEHGGRGASRLLTRRGAGLAALAGIALAGMTLAYYRMPFAYAAFVAVWLLAWALPRWRLAWRAWRGGLVLIAMAGAAGVLLALPWAPRLLGSNLVTFVEAGLGGVSASDALRLDFAVWNNLLFYAPRPLLAASAAGWLLAIVQRRWLLAALPLWYALLSAYLAGQVLGLPGANMLQSFAIIIALYIPLGLLAGNLLAELAALASRAARWRPAAVPAGAVVAAAVVLLALVGAAGQRGIAQPQAFALVARPDLRAAEWIAANTPPEARLLVEGFGYNYGSVVGADAGWWLPLLAGREVSMPPQYALFNEAPSRPDYNLQVAELVFAIQAGGPDAPEAVRLMCALGLTHAYVGQRQGLIGLGATQLYSPQALNDSPAFTPVYQQDRVSVFAFDTGQCP